MLSASSFSRLGIDANLSATIDQIRYRVYCQFEQTLYLQKDNSLDRKRTPRTIRGGGEFAYSIFKEIEFQVNLQYHTINVDSQVKPDTGKDPNITNDFKILIGFVKSF